jgi:hypothetical protein
MKHMDNEKILKQLADLDECISWLNTLGVRLNKTSRIYTYQKKLSTYVKLVNEDKAQELQESPEYLEYTNAFYEITELIDIYSGLKKVTVSTELKARLQKYVNGPININEENAVKATNNPRDFGFELFIGSRLLQAEYEIVFGEESDLEYKLEQNDFYVECKRPSSEKRITENIIKAYKQLERRYGNDANSKGLIALSISKIVNRDHWIFGVTNRANAQKAVQEKVEDFLQTHKNLWSGAHDKRTVGAIVLLQVPVYMQETNNFNISTYMAIIGFCEPNSNEFDIFRKMYEKIKKAINLN